MGLNLDSFMVLGREFLGGEALVEGQGFCEELLLSLCFQDGQRPFGPSEACGAVHRIVPMGGPDAIGGVAAFGPAQHRGIKGEIECGAEFCKHRFGLFTDICAVDDKGGMALGAEHLEEFELLGEADISEAEVFIFCAEAGDDAGGVTDQKDVFDVFSQPRGTEGSMCWHMCFW